MNKTTIDKRLSLLEAARQSSNPVRVFVIIGSDEPRQPGEITIGGHPTDETPLDSDITIKLHYGQVEPTNPAPIGATLPREALGRATA